jgi:hypothetical protein
MTQKTHASRWRDGINDFLQDKLDNLFAPSLGRLGDRYGQFRKSRQVANEQFILDIQFRAEILSISSITVIKLTSTRSEHLSSLLVKARNREAYFACFGVPSIASLWALSNTLLFISLCSHALRVIAYDSVGQLSLSALTTAANPCSAASDNIVFLLSISLTKIGMWDLNINAPSFAIRRNHSRAA